MRKMKASRPSRRVGLENLKVVLACLAAMVFTLPTARAGTDMKEITPPAVGTASEKDWTLEFGSGVGFSNVRNSADKSYTLIPFDLIASLKLDDVGLDDYLGGWLRGYTEFTFRGDFTDIASGPEHYLAGLYVGPRYNFVQKGWKVIPYIGADVGIIFSDANAAAGGLGQDFNFSFAVDAGARYNFNDSWFTRLGVEYRHVSNAGMSEPRFQNNAIDALGPQVTVGYAF
jgi:opacity protein-like surface antigen